MITFTYDPVEKKSFIEVRNSTGENPPTMIKVEDESNEGILKTCQNWLDSFGLANTEYRVNVQLH